MAKKKGENSSSPLPVGIGAPVATSPDLDFLFETYGMMYQVNPKVLKAICMIESNLGRAKSVAEGMRNPSNVEGSKSSDGKSWGVMQITIPTARDFDQYATPELLNNPEYSVRLAARYMQWVQKQFPIFETRYLEWCVKSYNQGVGNTSNERAGKSQGFAHDYWTKFQKAYSQIGGQL